MASHSEIVRQLAFPKVRPKDKNNPSLFSDVNPTAPGFAFSPDALHYQKHYFVDLRWGMFDWQVYSWSDDGYLNNVKRFQVKQLPRRHGKTHSDIAYGVEYCATKVTKARPIMAFYCPTREQAIRNAWKIFEKVLAKFPGHKIDKGKGEMFVPRPTLQDPYDFVTIYFFGIRGGTGGKRGGYYDVCIMDEVEFISQKFVKEVGMGSTFDRDGVLVLTGTPEEQEQLDFWLSWGNQRVQQAKAIKRGEKIPQNQLLADANYWRVVTADAYDLKVYPKEKLELYRSAMGEVRFRQEFLCQPPSHTQAYYYRNALRPLRDTNLVNNLILNPTLPLRLYYDLGIGKNKRTDRMAFIVAQFEATKIFLLWAEDIFGKSFIDIVAAVKQSPYGNMALWEHILPHDGESREQSDGGHKHVKFEEQLRRQQVAGGVRVHRRPTNREMEVGDVKGMLPFIFFNNPGAYRAWEALESHRRKYIKEQQIYEDTPSKTPHRDMADCVRHCVMDFIEGGYKAPGIDPHVPKNPAHNPIPDGRNAAWLDVGLHPTAGSVTINPDGSLKAPAHLQSGGGPAHGNYSNLPTHFVWNG